MSKQSVIKQEGVVLEALSNAMFRVQLGNKHEIIAAISGKLRMNYIKILPGDKVALEMSPYDLSRGRITTRLTMNKHYPQDNTKAVTPTQKR